MGPMFNTIPTTRELLSNTDRVIGDLRADLLDVVGPSALARQSAANLLVRQAAKALGWSEIRVLDAVNRAAGSL